MLGWDFTEANAIREKGREPHEATLQCEALQKCEDMILSEAGVV